jgi:hypothetical protein
VLKSTTNRSWQDITQDETAIYQYLDSLAHSDSPSKAITEFRKLIILGKGTDNDAVRTAWENIFVSQASQGFFNLVIYRSYLVIINNWLKFPELRPEILQLIALVSHVDPEAKSYDRQRKTLIERIGKFQECEQYFQLQRLAKVLDNQAKKESEDNLIMGDLIKRYPFLYKYCLLGADPVYEEQKPIYKIQKQEQEKFEIKFSQYIIYRARLVQIARARQLSHGAGKFIRRIENPTLLSEQEVKRAIKQFLGKPDSQYTHWQLANRFLAEHRLPTSYQIFKYNLYQYLVYSLSPKYTKYNFQQNLKEKIQNILLDCNSQKLDQFLLRRTCNQLIKFLIIENAQQFEPLPFINLVTNLGVAPTIGLLMKIILLCPDLKPELEKKFAIFFMRYESFNNEQVPWLVKSLENLQIAFSVYFGKVDLSFTKVIY